MYTDRKKVQPLSLNSLLEIRKHLEQDLKAMRNAGVTQTLPLQDLYDRCNAAIMHASVDRRISAVCDGK
jgi:hypothetical protein